MDEEDFAGSPYYILATVRNRYRDTGVRYRYRDAGVKYRYRDSGVRYR